MCGIAGIYHYHNQLNAQPEILEAMANEIKHRGPNNSGVFTHGPGGLAYRRLSIIDTKEQDQPILTNEDQTLRISFNGEIYNFPELKEELLAKGHRFYTGTDTEMVLHLYEEKGIDCVKRLNGIFAFAILDLRDNSMFVARDQMGIKPLYYTEFDNKIAFASEIKSLLTLPNLPRHVDPYAMNLYFKYRFVPDPLTMFDGIYKLPPGHCMKISENGKKIVKYYDLRSRFYASDSRYAGKIKSEAEAISLIREVVKDAVKRQLLADVPLGAFLSGGLDSSIVVGIMSQLGSDPVKTFSIGFSENEYDELSFAKQIGQRYGTDHHEIILSPDHVKSLPEILWHLDEPLADPAAVPVFFLSQLARKDVTVVLTGEGGDELFAGYKEDFQYPLGSLLKPMPGATRSALAIAFAELPIQRGKARGYRSLLSEKQRAEHILTDVFRFQQPPILPHSAPDASDEFSTYSFDSFWNKANGLSWLDKMMYLETSIWLSGDPLMKVDKMTMAQSLEARVPLLDMEVVELAFQIPSDYKNPQGVEKYLLRQAFKDILPTDIFERKKSAFELPLKSWLAHELKDMVNEHLSIDRLNASPYLDATMARKVVDDHQQDRKNYAYEVWALLCFQLWYQRWMT
ncbi:asparagine synthase (glutamine-hydrolyzing) [candidate division WWE3 bacterium]|nr:asparagine synthase (glutamine-hydrolyzing) [candidate division WWE3 bacterium]